MEVYVYVHSDDLNLTEEYTEEVYNKNVQGYCYE